MTALHDGSDLARGIALLAGPRRFEPGLEAEFLDDFLRRTHVSSQVAFCTAAVMYAAFGVLDLWLLPQTHAVAWTLRFGVVMPFYLAMIALTFVRGLRRQVPLIYAVTTFVCGVGIVLMIRAARPEEIGQYLYFAGLILVSMGSYVFLNLHYRPAAVANLATVLAFEVACGLPVELLASAAGRWHFVAANFFVVSANILGLVSSYRLELFARRDFLQRREIEAQRAQAEGLLLNILPREIAELLKARQQTIAESHPAASVLFADIQDFTPLSERLSPDALVELLNEVYSFCDSLALKHGVEKIKTIGDCYMAAAGVPLGRADHAQAMARMALELQRGAAARDFHGQRLSFRIGINSGPVVAGVIGKMKFSYDLWGDVVNTASRMESHGRGGAIQITRSTYELLREDFDCAPQGTIPVKGKGELEVWTLVGERGARPES